MVDGAEEEIDGREEVGIEDGNEIAGSRFQTFLEGAGFVAFPVGAVMVFDGVADVAVAFAEGFGKGMGVVGGIVEDLNLEEFPRVLHLDDLVDQALQHVPLVI